MYAFYKNPWGKVYCLEADMPLDLDTFRTILAEDISVDDLLYILHDVLLRNRNISIYKLERFLKQAESSNVRRALIANMIDHGPSFLLREDHT